jgi:hypothetical protein
MEATSVGRLVREQRLNAFLAWALGSMLGVAAVLSLLAGELLWAGFALVVGGVVLLPPIKLTDPTVMLPWEMVLLAGLPVLGRTFATVPVTGQVATYLSVAALALIVAAELELFTPVEMSYSFAIVFVVVTTLATAGVWAVVRWLSDIWLGTTLLLDPTVSEHVVERRLMWEFVASTVAGVVAGFVFEYYLRRRASVEPRLPDEHA